MKKIYFSLIIIVGLLFSCDPAENDRSMKGEMSADQLDLRAEPLVVTDANGKKINTNKIIVENKSAINGQWHYGSGISSKIRDTVLVVLSGERDILFTGLNGNGTRVQKTLKVNVDDPLYFPAPIEWKYFCGDGEKKWTWVLWGDGGYLNDMRPNPQWTNVPPEDVDQFAPGEGLNANMTFSINGATFTKNMTDGRSEKGVFSFDMSKKILKDDGTVWSMGKLYTNGVSVLCGKLGGAGPRVYEYEIMSISEDELIIAQAAPDLREQGKQTWFWVFKAVK